MKRKIRSHPLVINSCSLLISWQWCHSIYLNQFSASIFRRKLRNGSFETMWSMDWTILFVAPIRMFDIIQYDSFSSSDKSCTVSFDDGCCPYSGHYGETIYAQRTHPNTERNNFKPIIFSFSAYIREEDSGGKCVETNLEWGRAWGHRHRELKWMLWLF